MQQTDFEQGTPRCGGNEGVQIFFITKKCRFLTEIKRKTIKNQHFSWRGEEDLNLRTGLTVTRFPIVRLKPLSHLRMRCLQLAASN